MAKQKLEGSAADIIDPATYVWRKRWNFYSETNSFIKGRNRCTSHLQNVTRFVLLILKCVKLAICSAIQNYHPFVWKIFLILYRINTECVKTYLRVVVHALGWPSPVHHLLWLDTALCGYCHTLH
jgi:hypothetical protein